MWFRANTAKTRKQLTAIRRELTGPKFDNVTVQVAWVVRGRLMVLTPIGWTGATRRAWTVTRSLGSGVAVTNTNKIMLFLEEGTRAHGPVRARALYIPLTASAAIGGWNSGLVYGVDYILRKRVAGIKAMRIVERERPRALDLYLDRMTSFVHNVIRANT